MTTDIRGFHSGVLSRDVQLSLRDVNGFGGLVPAGGYHGSQRREGDWCVEEAVLGEPGPFGGGHQRLDSRQKVQLVRLQILRRSLSYNVPVTVDQISRLVANTQLSWKLITSTYTENQVALVKIQGEDVTLAQVKVLLCIND